MGSIRGYTHPVTRLEPEDYFALLKLAIQEDAPEGDITTQALVSSEHLIYGNVVSREEGVLCGVGVVYALKQLYPEEFSILSGMEDGEILYKGSCVLRLKGKAWFLFRMERILLNFIQYLSGIATTTRQLATKYPQLMILDTRKTLPGYRRLVKYSVYTGGGHNHRLHLSDMVMIKDNHLSQVHSILEAVKKVRSLYPEKKVELEIDSLRQLDEALSARPDIILLDNFNTEEIQIAVERIRSNAPEIKIEVSGGIDPRKLEFLASLGQIGVSMGYLTHTTRFLDIGLDIVNE